MARTEFTPDLAITDGIWRDVRSFGPTLDDTTVLAAIAAIGADEITLVFPLGTWTLSDSVTFPANITVRIERGAILSIATGKTLTINNLDVGIYTIFAGLGTVIIGDGFAGNTFAQWWGASPNASATVNTAAFNAALASNVNANLFIPTGHYDINDSIIYGLHHKIRGQSRTNTHIHQTDNTKYALSYTSQILAGIEVDSSLVFESFDIIAKYGIQCLTRGDDWQTQTFPKGPIFNNLSMLGGYGVADPNFNTGVEPTENELYAWGVGMCLTRWFDGLVSNCMIQYYGIGIFLDHNDVVSITGCRINANGRNIWVDGTGYSSHTINIRANDILSNFRVGSVFLKHTVSVMIENNYFESGNNDAGICIQTDYDRLTIIRGNKFDDTLIVTTPLMRLAPHYSALVTGNVLNQGAPTGPCEVLSTNWGNSFPDLVTWKDNIPAFAFPEPRYHAGVLQSQSFPQVKTIDNPYLMAHNSPKMAAGSLVSAWYWNLNATIDRWTTILGPAGTLVFYFTIQSRMHRQFLVRLSGIRVSGTGTVSVTHTDDLGNIDTVLGATTVGLISTTKSESFLQYFQIGATREATGYLSVTLTTDNIEYESVEIVPVNYIKTLFTWDPGNLGDAVGETSGDIAVVGAELGDAVMVAAPYDLQGITCTGYVKSADVVNVRLQNETGGAIDLASSTSWAVFVMPQSLILF